MGSIARRIWHGYLKLLEHPLWVVEMGFWVDEGSGWVSKGDHRLWAGLSGGSICAHERRLLLLYLQLS